MFSRYWFKTVLMAVLIAVSFQMTVAQSPDPDCTDGPSISGSGISVGSPGHTTVDTTLVERGYGAQILEYLPANTNFQVLAGPCGEWPGYWYVQTQSGSVGWVSDFDVAASLVIEVIPTPEPPSVDIGEVAILSCVNPANLTPTERGLWERIKDLLGINVYAAEQLCHPQCVDYVRNERDDSTLWAPRSASADPATWTAAADWNDLAINNGDSFPYNGGTYHVYLRDDLTSDPPQDGDIVVWEVDRSRPAGHVAILRSYNPETNEVTVDETNYDNNCSSRRFTYTYESSHMSIISNPELGIRSVEQDTDEPILSNNTIDRCSNRSIFRKLLDWLLRRSCR